MKRKERERGVRGERRGKKEGGRKEAEAKILTLLKKFSEPTAIIKFGTFPSFAKTYNIKVKMLEKIMIIVHLSYFTDFESTDSLLVAHNLTQFGGSIFFDPIY